MIQFDTNYNEREEEKRYNQLKNELMSLNPNVLQIMLKQNGFNVPWASKNGLIKRIIDCKMYGKYPRCPECGGGVLSVRYHTKFGHDGQGTWSCKGYMDDDEYKRCNFSSNTTFGRDKWDD